MQAVSKGSERKTMPNPRATLLEVSPKRFLVHLVWAFELKFTRSVSWAFTRDLMFLFCCGCGCSCFFFFLLFFFSLLWLWWLLLLLLSSFCLAFWKDQIQIHFFGVAIPQQVVSQFFFFIFFLLCKPFGVYLVERLRRSQQTSTVKEPGSLCLVCLM